MSVVTTGHRSSGVASERPSDTADLLTSARARYASAAWLDAFEGFSAADARTPLSVDDLWRLVWAAALTARDSEMLAGLERLYRLYTSDGESVHAARAAFWLGYRLGPLGEPARASGWFQRAAQLIGEDRSCPERGYLLLPMAQRQFSSGAIELALATATDAAQIGERFAERDLVALALGLRGRSLLALGEVEAGLAVLDDMMLGAAQGELSPLVTGLVYCNMISSCQRVHAIERAREWTEVLADWCSSQPQLVVFTGTCIVHRIEILEWAGAWTEALAEAQRASDRDERPRDPDAVIAEALYRQAEIRRLRGDFTVAERAYAQSNELGRDPQPGLALLRLAQGNPEAAVNTLRRLVASTTDPMQRLSFLPAYIEVLLEVGDREQAQAACVEMECLAKAWKRPALFAMSEQVMGAIHLANAKHGRAIESLRSALRRWLELGAPYFAARVRAMLGCAYRALTDEDGARLEFEAARSAFARLGAHPDLARVERWIRDGAACSRHGLTPRELQVLRLVARGKTNRGIAGELHLSEKTIDRHVCNIFGKLDVSSRAAATAFAYEHKLL